MAKKFIRTENTRVVFTHFMPFDEKYGMGKSEEELLKEGYLIDEIPEPERREGKIAEPHYTPEDGYYYEYVDVPEQPQETDVTAMRAEIRELKATVNALLGVE